MQAALLDIREEKAEAFENSRDADKALEEAREAEKAGAVRITSDHVVADDQRVSVAELFPTIAVGFIVTSVNGNQCEDLPFANIKAFVYENFPPHTLQMRRYDYRRDMTKGNWWSLQELRDQNK